MVPVGGSAPTMLGIMWMFQIIAFGLVSLRLYARLNVVQKYGWDDHFFNTAVVFLFVYNVLCTVAATYGLGQPLSSPPSDDESYASFLVNIAQSVINVDALIVKLSIAVFLMRLVPSNRTLRIILFLPVTIMGVLIIAGMIILWLACQPIEYSWKLGVPDGKCNGEEEFIVALIGGLSIVLAEVFYASFPWYLIWRLQMSKREKILIGTCMSFGFLSAVCSAFRLLALLKLAYSDDKDHLVEIVHLMIWHEADIMTQLICIGMSVCRPLYKDWLNNMVVRIESSVGRSSQSRSEGAKSGFSVIALQTVGGSAVPARSGGAGSRKDSANSLDAGVVKVERSWRVESKYRSPTTATLSGETASEEHILGQEAGVADADPEQQRDQNDFKRPL